MDKANKIFDDSLNKSFSEIGNNTGFKDLMNYKSMLGESEKPKNIKYIKPNFEREFSELKRYRFLEDMSMNDWLSMSKEGKVVNFDEVSDKLKNTKFDLNKIPKEKKNRFENHYKNGVICLPIVIKYEDEYYLLGGNTRITGLLSKKKNPKVWVIELSEKSEQTEATSSGSSGQYSQPLFSKTEANEATGSGSVGSYETPAMWAKSTNKKDFRGASKPQIPGGKFVTVKKKCKSFPYCNQGDVSALNIHESKDSIQENRVNAILRKGIYLKKLKSEVGFLGPLTQKDLFRGSSFKKEGTEIMNGIDEIYDDSEEINLENLFGKNILFKIWERYKKAMSRKRPDSVLGLYPFVNYLVSSKYPVYIFKHRKSYIIGQLSNGSFRISHFAPYSLSEGVEALREILKFDNVIFAVTDDLKDMLLKMGALYSGMVYPMFFRDEIVNKHILATDNKTLDKISEYLSGKGEDSNVKIKPHKEYPKPDVFLKRIKKTK